MYKLLDWIYRLNEKWTLSRMFMIGKRNRAIDCNLGTCCDATQIYWCTLRVIFAFNLFGCLIYLHKALLYPNRFSFLFAIMSQHPFLFTPTSHFNFLTIFICCVLSWLLVFSSFTVRLRSLRRLYRHRGLEKLSFAQVSSRNPRRSFSSSRIPSDRQIGASN